MEHIQSAIAKARKARKNRLDSGIVAVPEPTALQEASNQHSGDADRLWANLASIKLDVAHLKREKIFLDQSVGNTTPFDAIRTRMIHDMRTNGWRRVAITSPGPNCGKTTLCLNLAFSYTRLSHSKAMVVDIDMRHPTVGKKLNIENGEKDFSNVLAGEGAPEDYLLCYDQKLAFATNHNAVQCSAELLQDKETAHVVDLVEEHYKPDAILFDTPPMLACDDLFAFIDQVDCVLLVAAADSTTFEELEKCKSEIETHSNLMGVVLNKSRYLDKADRYGY